MRHYRTRDLSSYDLADSDAYIRRVTRFAGDMKERSERRLCATLIVASVLLLISAIVKW